MFKKRNLNWKQAKARFPRLKLFGDADNDRVKNIFDCRPFDKRRQGKGKYFMLYSKKDEHGLVHGRDELKSAKRILKKSGLKGVKAYEYDYEE